MKWGAILLGLVAVLGFVGGALFATFTKKVVPAVKEGREAVPTRVVSVDWRVDRYSPGHSHHVLNLALDCNDCHDPAKVDFKGVDIGVCSGCHVEQASHPHPSADDEIEECTTCHAFKFTSNANGPWDCGRCHGPFDTPTHTGLAMHDGIACANCHHPHEPMADTATNCADCHETFRVQHGRPELSGDCVDCHGGHKLASEAAACMSCHQKPPEKVMKTAVFARGHDECVDCHEPHSFSAATATACESCHRRMPVLAKRTARDHRDCGSCHDPHAVRAAGDASCSGCHREVVSTHPVDDRESCGACHDSHPEKVQQIAMRCTSCHEEAGGERGYHARGTVCTDCHEPHGFDLSNVEPQSLCFDCHSKQARLSRRVPDHASCASCHTGTAHDIGEPADCASCHGELRDTSPEGHQECASCHEPHGGAIAASNTCTSCHESTGLPGLHQIPGEAGNPGHSDCATCHNPHDSNVRADRASCMECHTDIANHQPDANVCTGCHTFIRGHAPTR